MNFKFHLSFILAATSFATASRALAADTKQLTLTEAVQMALRQNRALKIARLKVVENQNKKAAAKADYFPGITNHSTFTHTTATENIGIPAGAFGVFPGGGFVPNREILIEQGNQTYVTSGTTLAQPLTQLIRIRQANRIAAAETASSRDELKKAENEVAVRVHELYYGILVAGLQKRAAHQETVYAETNLRESEEDVRNGNALKISTISGRATLLQSEQSALTADLQLSDLTAELNDLLGLPVETALELSPIQPASVEEGSRESYLRLAFNENPQILSAMEAVEKGKAGVSAAKSAYIPDITAIAHQSYQNGVPFLVHNFGTFGLNLTYDVFDFGKRRATVREREAQLAQAQENLMRVKEAVGVQMTRALNKVERTKHMLQVSMEVVKLRTEGERLADNQVKQGLVLISARRQAAAASYKAQADLLQAQLAYLLAGAELDQVVGRTPGL